jgi:molybdate transport system substrate-binding protein
MKARLVTVAAAVVGIALVILPPPEAVGQPATVRVLCSAGLKVVVEGKVLQWERLIGHPINVQFNTSVALKAKIDNGEGFDLAILPTRLIDELVKEDKISTGTHMEIARAGIGLGIRAGASKPDVSTPERLKRVLLNAKSITYPENGASRASIEKMFKSLGIVDEVGPKVMFQNGEGRSQASVAEGRVELVITLISEILPIQGVELLGPLPPELQTYISFTAGVGTNSPDSAAAKALIQLISDPGMAPIFRSRGLEPH